MSIIYTIMDTDACVTICISSFIAVFLFLILVSSLHKKQGKNFQEIMIYKIEDIFRAFFDTTLIIILIGLFIYLPVSMIFFMERTSDSHFFSRPEQFFAVLLFLIIISFIAFCIIKPSYLKKRMWKVLDYIFININFQVEQKNQSSLIKFMDNLHLLVIWCSIIAFLLAGWGFLDMFIINFKFGFHGLYAPILIFISLMKISISFLLFTGTYMIMIRPLKKLKFWRSMLEG